MQNVNSIPGRASDAGPDTNTTMAINRQSLYSLLVDEALEEVRGLDRCYLDDRKVEQQHRIEAITRAQIALDKLKEVV
jgi:hypothetical protein